MGLALKKLGRYSEAVDSLRKGHEIGSASGSDWQYPSEQWLREAEELAANEERLLTVIRGQQLPRDGKEGIQAAKLAYNRQLHAVSADLFAKAFAIDATLAADTDIQSA